MTIELPAKYHSQFSPSGSTFLPCLGLPSKSHRENSISSIFLESPHQVDMKNVVKCYKHFFAYFNALKTHSEACFQHHLLDRTEWGRSVQAWLCRVTSYTLVRYTMSWKIFWMSTYSNFHFSPIYRESEGAWKLEEFFRNYFNPMCDMNNEWILLKTLFCHSYFVNIKLRPTQTVQ